MVLLPHIANWVEQASGRGSGGSGDMHVHIHGIANDGPGIERMFRSQKGVIADTLRDAMRSGRLTPRTIY